MRLFTVLLISFLSIYCDAQEHFSSLEKAIDNSNFKKLERRFKKEVRRHKKGQVIQNGTSSYTVHHETAEYLVSWLKKNQNIIEAHSDKCSNHISIYPGWFTVGAIFQTKNGIKERAFTVQEGKTGNIHLFKWRFHMFKSKNVLVYKHMKEIPGFVQIQRWNCLQQQLEQTIRDSIPIKSLLGKWKGIDRHSDSSNIAIRFELKNNELQLFDGDRTYSFWNKVSNTAILGQGIFINWPPYDCTVKIVDKNHLTISYSSMGNELISVSYARQLE